MAGPGDHMPKGPKGPSTGKGGDSGKQTNSQTK